MRNYVTKASSCVGKLEGQMPASHKHSFTQDSLHGNALMIAISVLRALPTLLLGLSPRCSARGVV